MSLQIYKPNSKNAGSAYTFSKTTDKKTGSPVFYISAISQYSWDDNKKTGSFAGNSKDPTKTINVKISEFEAGSFISSFSNRYEYTAFHSFDGNNTTIKVTPWDKSTKISKYNSSSKTYEDTFIDVPAFGITLSKGKGNSIKIALEPGEVEVLKSLLSIFIKDSLEFKIQLQNSYSSKNSDGGNANSKKKKVEEVEEDEFEDAPF